MSIIDDSRRYADLALHSIGNLGQFVAETENATAVQVERGTIYPLLLKPPGAADDRVHRLIELTRSERLSSMAVVDRTGHHRPIYRSMLVYSWLKAFQLVYETLDRDEFGRWEEALRVWCDLLEADLQEISWDATLATAARGASAAEACWAALTLHAAGKTLVRDVWTDLAAEHFGKLARAQQPGGAFLATLASDNPETHWYHELAILHAAASFAVQTEDRTVAAAVKRNTEFHMNETQPDHATTQPFAVFAFIWNTATRPLADQVLHAVHTQHPGGATGVAAILLADAVHCLRLFVR